MKREPLKSGTIIEFCGERAEVVDDTGSNSLTVKADGCIMRWFWTYGNESCKVVKSQEA